MIKIDETILNDMLFKLISFDPNNKELTEEVYKIIEYINHAPQDKSINFPRGKMSF